MMGAVLHFPRLRETYPDDLLWAAPGVPEARASEVFEPEPRQHYRMTPADGNGGWLGLVNIGLMLLAAFLAGCVAGGNLALTVMAGVL